MNQRFSDPKVKPALQAPGSPYAFDLCVKATVEPASWSCAAFSVQRPSPSAFVGVLPVIVFQYGCSGIGTPGCEMRPQLGPVQLIVPWVV
jgi:hypothetical protein